MEFVYFLLLGIVQGLTEFLPVSSSGHLVLVDKIFGVESGNFLFLSVILHIATLLSVVIVFWKDIIGILKRPFSKDTLFFGVAFLCTCVVVFVFRSFLESAFGGQYLGVCFMATSILLMLTYFASQKQNIVYKQNSYKSSCIIGLVQGLAVLPGISRSGSTISAGVIMGLDPDYATSFSFILSIPIILASLVYEIYSCVTSGSVMFGGNAFYLVMSFVVAFGFGLLAIKIMKKMAKTKKYYIFSIYLAILAIVVCFVWLFLLKDI